MKKFLSCNHPRKINTSKGNMLVPCGHCVQCMNAKHKRYEVLLDLESQHHKYVELINLTYDSEHIPYLDFTSWVDYNLLSRHHNGVVSVINPFCVPVVFGNRSRKRFNPKTRSYYWQKDSDFDHIVSTRYSCAEYFGLDTNNINNIIKHLSDYEQRIDKYFQLFPHRKRGVENQGHHVPILWYDDIHRFTDRLQKWCRQNFGEKVRYFVIGEYGTRSLRPHWHLLLFHDSPKLRREFSNVFVYPNSTRQNPRECSLMLLCSEIWAYGDITTTTTDKRASSYLASYVNKPSDFPTILDPYPQKTFKSIFLGENRDFQQVATLWKNRDFERLTTSSLTSRKGLKHSVSVPSSSYYRFNLGFTGANLQDYQATYALLSQTVGIISKYDFSIFDDQQVRIVSDYISRDYNLHYHIDTRLLLAYRYISSTRVRCSIDGTFNPLKSLFYAAKKLYKMSHLMDIHPLEYCRILSEFRSWLALHQLSNHFQLLQDDWQFAYEYYQSFDDALGILIPDKYFKYSSFLRQQTDANITYTSSIKHRDVINYINNL